MTIDELETLCSDAETQKEQSIILKISRSPKGETCYVVFGLRGRVLGPLPNGATGTVVQVKTADLRKWLIRHK